MWKTEHEWSSRLRVAAPEPISAAADLALSEIQRGIELSPNSAMEGKDARRRLVQSTLFPRRESVIKEGENCGGNGEEEVSEEEEEWGGSSKRRRGSKVKANSRSKTMPPGSKKVVENGNGTSSKQVNDSDSPVPDSDSPVLPKNLDRLELSFSVPSVDELLPLVHMICASEKAKINPCLVERFVDFCQRDIRKTIVLLQFWCQGQTLERGNEFHRTHWPVLFDLDAGHHILPKVIHFACPSKLSELVAEEVVKSLILMEQTNGLMNTMSGEDRNDCSAENTHMHNAELDPVKVKKKAMLSLHCSLLDEVECAQFEANSELFDFSCSPVALPQQNGRRKINTVLSSDSEDEVSGGSIPVISAGVDINAEIFPGYQLLDECSRMDFTSQLKSLHNPEADQKRKLLAKVNVCYWNEILWDHQQFLVRELIPIVIQLDMSSIIAQHGMCFYAKEVASLGLGFTNTSNLASEMLSSSASSVALGKLASQDQRKVDRSDTKTCKDLKISTSALHEYISTLSQISRFEASRISEFINRNQRRARVPRHYLNSGLLSMSSEEISLLGRYNCYQKGSFSS
ncbi:hypothetical protein Sango_2172000 [Sesamum angolense]|uniref:Uncharacterized protein n=1 Tax=Sesamum angolense TaxID=2727404 RepID=A0AAE1WD06_9LAMI|nr:hypothetical protein Sango_2172000 [Sesamum angolense]